MDAARSAAAADGVAPPPAGVGGAPARVKLEEAAAPAGIKSEAASEGEAATQGADGSRNPRPPAQDAPGRPASAGGGAGGLDPAAVLARAAQVRQAQHRAQQGSQRQGGQQRQGQQPQGQQQQGPAAPAAAPTAPKARAASAPLRRGKWTPEEEAFTSRIIHDFTNGYLPLAPGTTLRSYLSEKLNWWVKYSNFEFCATRI